MSQSSKQALVVPINKRKHPGADSLSIVNIGDFQVVINTTQWDGVETGVYIEPETIVNTDKEEFSFLRREGKHEHVVKAKKLRGEWSVGLLVPAPPNFEIGQDCWDWFELKHYEPEEYISSIKLGDSVSAPPYWGSLGKYDLENYRKYRDLFVDGEYIDILEKLNGANQSCVYSDGEYHVKSRNLWKKKEGCDFWKALECNEPLMKYLRDNPNHLVQGECIGKVKGFQYGLNGSVEFRAFDIRTPNYKYVDSDTYHDICQTNGIKIPRVFARKQPHTKELVLSFVDGDQQDNPKGIREGVVVRPIIERNEPSLKGRLILKCVSNTYLEKY